MCLLCWQADSATELPGRPRYRLRTRESKMTGKGNPEELPISDAKRHMGDTLCVRASIYPHELSFLLINTAPHFFMGIHLRQSCGGLVPGHWSSGGVQHAHGCNLTPISGWELKTRFKPVDITFILQRRASPWVPAKLPNRSEPRWPGRA